jgi:hypothetical protein
VLHWHQPDDALLSCNGTVCFSLVDTKKDSGFRASWPTVTASLKKQLFKISPLRFWFSTLLRALITMLTPSSTFREFFINVAVAALTFFCLEAWRKAIGKPKAERDLQDESKDHEVLQQNPQGLPSLAASNGDLRPGRLLFYNPIQ